VCCAAQGYSEEEATAKLGSVDVYTTSFKAMKNTISGSPLRTFMKLLVDATTGKLVGAHMVGDEAAEIMQVRQPLGALDCTVDDVTYLCVPSHGTPGTVYVDMCQGTGWPCGRAKGLHSAAPTAYPCPLD
jgi:pyruvate/2-oxoglutarate dehydrogenase complex dihydrolipoamide dehydrogenase (E3) component